MQSSGQAAPFCKTLGMGLKMDISDYKYLNLIWARTEKCCESSFQSLLQIWKELVESLLRKQSKQSKLDQGNN